MKRLLLIFAIGIAFAPAVFAGGPLGDSVGIQVRSDAPGESFCQAGITDTKDLSDAVADSDQGSGTSGHTTAGSLSGG